MTAVVLALAPVAAVLCVVALACWRRRVRRPADIAEAIVTLPPKGPEIDALDDAGFRSWVGVPAATFDRYVDTGLEDFEIYLADRPERRVGEDPAEPAT